MSDETENPLGPPPWLNAPPVEAYPYEETHDLRQGPDLHPALLGLLPFIGLWRGRGQGGFPAPEDFDFAQEVRISHDGRPFLAYESRIWILDADSKPVRMADRETGWWRPVLVNDRPEPGEWVVRETFEPIRHRDAVVLRHLASNRYVVTGPDGVLRADAATEETATAFTRGLSTRCLTAVPLPWPMPNVS